MIDARRRPCVTRLLIPLAVLGLAACAGNRPAAPAVDGSGAGSGPAGADAPEAAVEAPAAGVPYDIPPEHLPPPGQCRVWMPDEPPEAQASERPVGRCSTLRETIPAGGWLVYRPADAAGVVRVWQYGEGGRVLHQRIYDVETGALLRHVAPTGS